MGLFGWWKRNGASDGRLRNWRKAWHEAAEAGDTARRANLRAELEALGLPEEEIEIEREMLDGLQQLEELAREVGTGGLPVVSTGHRVVGGDTCHFTSPVSMPDEASQPSGRLLLTSARAIFVGGANGAAVPWHAVTDVVRADRDLVLVRADREKIYRFRCNAYSDAMCAAYLSRRLATARRRPPQSL